MRADCLQSVTCQSLNVWGVASCNPRIRKKPFGHLPPSIFSAWHEECTVGNKVHMKTYLTAGLIGGHVLKRRSRRFISGCHGTRCCFGYHCYQQRVAPVAKPKPQVGFLIYFNVDMCHDPMATPADISSRIAPDRTDGHVDGQNASHKLVKSVSPIVQSAKE